MSEDVDDPGSARRNADRRTPRFSWNLAYEATFFRSLCESMQMGFKENHSFKAGAWERAAVALRDKHSAYPEKSHLINKADNARKKFRMWRGLREDPEFLYNPTTRMVTASEEAWQRHFEREPLSKALRGRPFDHEEYMEILFPDVIGSGGAPKRIMKKRKGPDGTPLPVDNSGNPGQAVMDLSVDLGNIYPQQPTTQATSQMPQLPTPASSQVSAPTIAPPRNSIASSIALTPPDENVTNPRKRFAPDSNLPGPNQSAEKRRGRPSRFSTNVYNTTSVNSTPNGNTSLAFGQTPSGNASTPARNQPIHPSFNATALIEDGLYALAEALKARNPPKWSEQAMEIFFRDFSEEDADLQLKIAEKALTDENKAMVFVKSTPELRRHWVGRLREVHMRSANMALGNPLGLGGRVGEEAS